MTEGAGFYWQTARDSLLTPSAILMFQIAAGHDGEVFDDAKTAIDQEYEDARGRSPTQRHGGNFQTFIRVFEEAGWMWVDESAGRPTLRLTPAGRQALVLLGRAPEFLRAVPKFLVDLLSRFQLNNPGGPAGTRNQDIKTAIEESDIFPYWTIWKIMRECGNRITTEELRRFVFRLQRSEDIQSTITQILAYRRDTESGLLPADLDAKYSAPIEGAVGEPKYVMGRAGMHIGRHPPLITKPDSGTYALNPLYFPLIDEVLSNEPVYRDYIDPETWFRHFGERVVMDNAGGSLYDAGEEEAGLDQYPPIPEDDPVWIQVSRLLALGKRNLLFVGPPAAGKTRHALGIGAKLVRGHGNRFHNIQFHQSLSYDDFVEGYVPARDPRAAGSFALVSKVFLKACEHAASDGRDTLHVLVIDELNRGDPSRIFGDAMTYIEWRNTPFRLGYSGRVAVVPENLVIIATMNPFDKSIADLDQALDRRFEKISMPADASRLRSMLVDSNRMEPELAGRVLGLFEFVNEQLQGRIGHAYFVDARDRETLALVWKHKVWPVLEKELRFDRERLRAIEEKYGRDVGQEVDDEGADGRNAAG